MTNEEKQKERNQFENGNWNMSCFRFCNMPGMMEKCFGSMEGNEFFRARMIRCMKICRWFIFIAVLFVIACILFGIILILR